MTTMLTSQRIRDTLVGPCVALRFLVNAEVRAVDRQQMEGFSDSAIFHRLMDLLWTFREPEAVDLLMPEQRGYLAEFTAVFDTLPWQVIPNHPHISEVVNDDLSALLPSATRLLESLERRTRPPIMQRWWRQALCFLRLR